ncbi:kinase domain protein [Necator americanus]|uniref:non-specific serine/threonine protein kinase n=1 Tax=Necator americanus TaxID=51031 RepID=W2SFK3_NECAM|nr:kinase domain protein [Necator americanus]ETN68288.1 kinase domain protein [Necator americanus]
MDRRGFNKFKKHYKLKGELGRGGFGIVYRAVRVADELPVAVKFIDRRTVREWGKINDEQVPMEICMLAKCSKIRVMGPMTIPAHLFIQFLLSFNEIKHVHTRIRTFHDDQDENVVIDLVTGDTKLIDFGAATVLKKSHYTDFQGTRLYCPPEWFLHSLYLGKEAAVWSLGVLLYNSLNGRLPFKNEKDICTAHLLGPLPFYTSVSAEAKDLIACCLAFDPFSRCSLEEILKHPWVTKSTGDWLTLSAAAGKNLQDKPKEDEREGESGVGSSASSSTAKTHHPDVQPVPPARFSKTSLLAAPSSDEIKAVVHASKTKSVYHGTGNVLRPTRRRAPPPNSAVLTALRRAMSRDRQIRA